MTRILNSFGLILNLRFTILVCRSPVITCNMTMIPNPDIFIGICLVANMTLLESVAHPHRSSSMAS